MAEVLAELAPGTSVEVWFQDEMRVGQKNKLTYRWARKGSRPRAAHDQRTQSTYLFGGVCPERGAGAAIVLPACNCEAMQLHLDEIEGGKQIASIKAVHSRNIAVRPDVNAELTLISQPDRCPLGRDLFLSRTPRPPPFSSMNSTPAISIAVLIFSAVSSRPPNLPSADSSRATVGSETPECCAKSAWDQPSRARAALT